MKTRACLKSRTPARTNARIQTTRPGAMNRGLRCDTPEKAVTLAPLTTNEFRLTLHRFMEKLGLAGFASRTIGNHAYNLSLFFAWLETSENITALGGITDGYITAWNAYLHYGTFKNGRHLTAGTIGQRLASVKIFLRLFHEAGDIKEDLSRHVVLPKIKRALPRNVPSVKDMALLLDTVKPVDSISLRDRCMMELLYATGMRATELLTLPLDNVDLTGKTVFVTGKGSKDRLIPLGPWIVPWLLEYLETGRPRLIDKRRPKGFLFLSKHGNAMYESSLCLIISRWVEKAGLMRRISPHGFRHACATHLLEGGADIRYIQELLGHTELSTTQIYTRVDITALKKAHLKYHPRQRER
jgi:integrase/recombinase XerD